MLVWPVMAMPPTLSMMMKGLRKSGGSDLRGRSGMAAPPGIEERFQALAYEFDRHVTDADGGFLGVKPDPISRIVSRDQRAQGRFAGEVGNALHQFNTLDVSQYL